MHHLAAALLFATTFMTITAVTWAQTRDACTKACENAAKSCFSAAYVKHDACQPAANKGCATVAPANKFACLTDALRECKQNQSAETNECRTTFDACRKACGPSEKNRVEFWCVADVDEASGRARERTVSLCTGTPGTTPADQLDDCTKRFTPNDPTAGYSIDCEPLD